MNQEEILRLLRDAHEEPIAEAHYAAVRARVLSELAAQRHPWRRWVYGFAAIGALAVMLSVVRMGHAPVATLYVPPSHLRASGEGPVHPTLDHVSKSRVSGRGKVLRASGRRIVNPPDPEGTPANLRHKEPVIGPPVARPLMVKLVTDDPNIVIYWISGE